MKSLSKAVIKSVLPDAKIQKVSLHKGGPGLMPLLYVWAKRTASVFYVWAAESESFKKFYICLILSNFFLLQLQTWMEIRFWISIGLIHLMLRNDLYPSLNLLGNSTQNMSGRTLYGGLESEPLAWPIQAWFFNLHNTLTDSALYCCSCFLQTNRILASTDRIIQYIVSIYFILNLFKYI